ncbi:MAG: PAS domain S-box protein [Caldilineaceae bacterium]
MHALFHAYRETISAFTWGPWGGMVTLFLLPLFLIFSFVTIQRKQAEITLENFFRLSLDLMCIAGLDGYFKAVNPAFEQSLGYSADELLAMPFKDFIHPDDVEQTLAQLSRLAGGREVLDFENRYRCKDGSYRWFSWRAVVAGHGLIYAVARDVTTSKRLQALTEQTHAAAHVGGWEFDFLTNELYWTIETYRIHDTLPTEYRPTIDSTQAFYPPESKQILDTVLQRAQTVGEPWDTEVELITAKNRRIWVHVVGKVQLEQGRPVKAYGSCQDITARKQIENALRQSEARLRAILDVLPDMVFVTDQEGVLLDAHTSNEEDYYVPPAEFLNRRVDDVLPLPVATQMLTAIRQAVRGELQVLEYSLLSADELRYYEARYVPLDVDKVLGIVRDVTERKQAEEERSVRKIAEAVPHIMYVYDMEESCHVYVNRQVNRDLGYTPEEFLAMHADFVNEILHPDDIQRFPSLRSRWETAQDGEIFETEYQMRHKNGEWRWFLGRDTVFLRSLSGAVDQIIGTAQDITEQKCAQQQILAALKEKEALLKEVHHRVKNNLQIVNSLLNLQAAQIKDAAVLSIFTETQNRVRSMALLHEMLYRTENLARINFQRYVDNLCAYLFRAYGVERGEIQLHTTLPEVTLDIERAIPCGLIINELVSNALKYAFPKHQLGAIWVEMIQSPTASYQLSVRDNGVGLPVDLTYEQVGSLGLRLVYDLVLQLGGTLAVRRDNGTAFTVTFGD